MLGAFVADEITNFFWIVYNYKGTKLDEKNIFADVRSVCIVTSENEQEVAYFFEEQDWLKR